MDETKKNDLDFLSEPSRQSYAAILLILFRLGRVVISQTWYIFVILIMNPNKSKNSWFAISIVSIAVVTAVFAIISYFKFYYYVKNGELVIEKGVFQKTKLNVPFDRIQTINFKENIIHQMFNVVSLEIDTAGSKGNEFSITALSKARALTIRDFLIDQKKSSVMEETFAEEVQPVKNEKLLLRLSPADLLKVGVSQNHLRTAAIIVAFMFSMLSYVEDATDWKMEDEIEKIPLLNPDSVISVLLVVVPIFIIASFFISLVRTVFRYFNLQFLKTDIGFKVIAGLFTRNEHSAAMQKIQLINWTTNPIKQLFGMYDISLKQAASSALARKQSIYVPGCYEEQLLAVRDSYFPEEVDLSFETHKIHPLFIFRRTLFIGIYPALLATANFYGSYGMDALWWLMWIPTVALGVWMYYRNYRYHVSDEGIRITSGMIGIKNILLKWYKIQAVEVSQGYYQRRKGLANFTFHTAAGDVKLSYIEIEKAKALEDFILYKIENSQVEWM